MTHEEAGYYMVGGKMVVFELSLERQTDAKHGKVPAVLSVSIRMSWPETASRRKRRQNE
jgi:hypothetical protein